VADKSLSPCLLEPSHSEDLVNQNKSGFNPFFISFAPESENDEKNNPEDL